MIYEEPKGNRTPMKLTPGTSGRVPEKLETALVSVLSVKR
jgi:hypothetical protein